MSIHANLRRIIFVAVWVLAGAGIVVLLIAAVNSRTDQVCKGYEISIGAREEGNRFIDKSDIIRVITDNNNLPVKNRVIKSFDLNKIETRLKNEVWVMDAELFFDNSGILKVNITERQPIARVFASSGESFYIDSNCRKLPLSNKATARVPVFTGYPFSGKKVSSTEKKLLKGIKEFSMYLAEHPFWLAQVAQVDINHSREFEIIPTIGDHVVEFGSAKNIDEKFRRLMIFYQQVLATTGMEKYDRIKVQYDKQVVGIKNEPNK